ncbi:hypothetical protein [Nonomuraea sp. KM88]|uniref:hypothetical protein n=1 Tax=Nonomuraea sp. KM88 TaxID=3457427 RepID=UPI003FCD0CC9
MGTRRFVAAGLGAAVASVLFPYAAHAVVTPPPTAAGAQPATAAEPAEPAEPAAASGRPLIGDVIVFNDEIVEPVSAPVSTCGGLMPVLSTSPGSCDGASRVSDDDA